MNIGQAAAASGMSAKMLRHCESIGLVGPAARSASGYRLYTDADVDELRFIRRARGFGLSTARIRTLVGLWRDAGRPSREVKRVAEAHVRELDRRIADLTQMRDALALLAGSCRGDQGPDCAILDGLAGGVTPPAAPGSARS